MPSEREADGWQRVDHACRFCGGRIASKAGQFLCFVCGAATGGAVKGICGCGLVGAAGRHPFVCAPNPQKSAASPAEIVIVSAPNPRAERRTPD